MRPSDSAAPRGTPISGLAPEPGAAPTPPAPATAPGPPPTGAGPAAEPAAGADPAHTGAAPGTGERHLALVWSAERDVDPYRSGAVRLLGPRDVLHALHVADRRAVRALRECGNGTSAAAAARVLGLAGEHGAVWLAAGLAGGLADPAGRGRWARATATVAAAHLMSMALKRAVRRPRPGIPGAPPLVRTAGDHSFPSSHAASSTAAVVAYGALLPGAVTVPSLAAAMCVSRLVAGVHYPSDVVAGALLGGAVARALHAWVDGAPAGGGGRHG